MVSSKSPKLSQRLYLSGFLYHILQPAISIQNISTEKKHTDNYCLLGYNTVHSGKFLPMFRKKELPPCLGQTLLP
jgi:hypothetical protein